jgi:hypothetical protein
LSFQAYVNQSFGLAIVTLLRPKILFIIETSAPTFIFLLFSLISIGVTTIRDSRLGLNIAFPLKLGALPQALRELPLIWPRTPDQGLSFVGYAFSASCFGKSAEGFSCARHAIGLGRNTKNVTRRNFCKFAVNLRLS